MAVGAALVALAARWSFPVPGSPVPVSAQTLAVLVVGLALGSARGAGALALYLAAGAAGLPVFADGAAGLEHLLGPTGGYLLGFVAGAAVAGRAPVTTTWRRRILLLLAAHGVIFALGVPWLAVFVGTSEAVTAGLLPFLLGALIKSLLAWSLLEAGTVLLKRMKK
ncbi:MAG: biotin transporter BioY [Acidobacteriota bacterium]|nr:biotin transporter BioY [Acidobacteriota bacterium]